MIHSKNKIGFSLTEVMFSIAILSMAMSPLLILQSSNTYNVSRASRSYDRFMAGYAFLLGGNMIAPEESLKARNKNIADLKTQLTYSASSAPDTSSLKKIPGLLIERVTLNWQERRSKKNQQIITVLFVPKQEKEKE